MTDNQGSGGNYSAVLAWIQAPLFEPVFKEIYPDFRQTMDFKVRKALSPGENYATIMLRLQADIELNDGSSQNLSLMLKTAHDSEVYRELMKDNNIFVVETAMYREVVPEFERMYKEVGVEVKFGPKSYALSTQEPYILLEDLRPKGFINVDRLEGLDLEHSQCVLQKLAQWHAASAVRVATKGAYEPNMSCGFLQEKNRETIREMFKNFTAIQLACVKEYDGHDLYYDRMLETKDNRLDALYDAAKIDASEFNVLNHGDCWANNVMFKYDDAGQVKETYLIDYQVPRYGSPAQDLYYFILSSTKYELKIKNFDYFIKYYHSQLLKHLKILNYPGKMVTLRDIHISLHKYNAWAFSTVSGAMAAVLLDPHNDAHVDNLISNNDAAIKLKMEMYSNPRYRKHCEMLLPWLYNRGAI